MTFLTDVIQVETTQSGYALELRFNRPVTDDDRKSLRDAHNAELNTRPAPARCDELETTSSINGTLLVTRQNAEEVIAAERAEKNAWIRANSEIIKRKNLLDADNAALTARVNSAEEKLKTLSSLCEEGLNREKSLEAKLAAARKALEFYADASKWDDGYFKSEDDGTVLRAYPSSIEKDQGNKARAALEDRP